MESTFHSLFSPARLMCRLPYTRFENRFGALSDAHIPVLMCFQVPISLCSTVISSTSGARDAGAQLWRLRSFC